MDTGQGGPSVLTRPFKTTPRSRETVVEELKALCTTNDKGCWLLPGSSMNASGHKRVQYQGVQQGAHVFVYETLVGPVPVGHDLNHTCEEPPCINPEHMEPITRAEHMRLHRLSKTICKRGHPLSGSNVRVNSRGQRVCLQCQRIRNVTCGW